MLFNSPVFLFFFVVVFCLYWALRDRRYQNVMLLAASYVFYGAWSWIFLLLVSRIERVRVDKLRAMCAVRFTAQLLVTR